MEKLSPITGTPMELRTRTETITYRKEEFQINYFYYFCTTSGEEFTDEEIDEFNLKQVYNQYRVQHRLPFPDEIKEIREKYDLSATKMAEVLGFGTNGYRNYEAGEIPSDSNARLIQTAKNPVHFKGLVEISSAFSEREKEKILDRIYDLIKKEEKQKPFDFLNQYLFDRVDPNQFNGYTKPSLEKFAQMVFYFAQNVKPHKTKLNKLLFYADFLTYKYQLASISGAQYVAIKMGPVPKSYDSLYEYVFRTGKVKVLYENFGTNQDGRPVIGERFIAQPGFEFDASLFNDIELDVLEKVKDKFINTRTNDIINISHQERAWKENEGESMSIDYRYGFDLIALN